MDFTERLRQETAEALNEQQLKAQQEAEEKERLESEAAIEKEQHSERRQQAEDFREESGVSVAIKKLGEFLKYSGRGSSNTDLGNIVHYTPVDPDSVFDSVEWDKEEKHHYSNSPGYGGSPSPFFSEKFFVVETCPDGRIMFGRGRTTIQVEEWRSKKRDIFDAALEEAFRNPYTNKYRIERKDGKQVSIRPVYYLE